MTILDFCNLKEFADDNLSLMKIVESYPKGRKHCEKRRNCLLQAISPFPMVFSKEFFCKHVKTRFFFGKV